MPPPFTPYFAVNASLISFWVGLAFVLFFTISTLAPCGSFPIFLFTVTFHKYADIINLPSYIPLGSSVFFNHFSAQSYTIIPLPPTFSPAQFRHKTPPIWASTANRNTIGRNRNQGLWRFAKAGRCRCSTFGKSCWWCADCTTIAAPTKYCCAPAASVRPLSLLLCEEVRSFRLPFAEPCPQKATIKKAWKLFALPSAVVYWTTKIERQVQKDPRQTAWALSTYSPLSMKVSSFQRRE